MDLDFAVSHAIYLARSLERAVHDRGPWTMSLCGIRVQAVRRFDEDGVTFSAAFPEMDLLGESFPLILESQGEPIRTREFTAPDYGDFVVEWNLNAPPVGVA